MDLVKNEKKIQDLQCYFPKSPSAIRRRKTSTVRKRQRGGRALGNDASYFGTDLMGSVRSVTDGYGSVKNLREYDVFGTPLETCGYNSGLEYGYAGKPYDAVTEMYNYGFCDYSPATARFTTLDPVRDGTNWFTYVANDPVNFVDLWGLMASDAKQGKTPIPTVVVGDPLLFASVNKGIRGVDVTYTMTNNLDVAKTKLGNGNTTIGEQGCTLLSYTRIASTLAGISINPIHANEYAKSHNLFVNDNELTVSNGIALVNGLLEDRGILGVSVSLEESLNKDNFDTIEKIKEYDSSNDEFFAISRISTTDASGFNYYEHSLNLASNPIRDDESFFGMPNIYYDDTSGVRSKHNAGERANSLVRTDIFRVNRTLVGE